MADYQGKNVVIIGLGTASPGFPAWTFSSLAV